MAIVKKSLEKKVTMGVKIAQHLLDKLDAYAYTSGLSRSSAVSALLSLYFQGTESVATLSRILEKLDEAQQGK